MYEIYVHLQKVKTIWEIQWLFASFEYLSLFFAKMSNF